jgi:type IV pilus biogenesis protein CpaD/CtpE
MSRWPWLLLLTVAACTPDYPMDKPGTWNLEQYGGANDANLRTMVVNPRDLIAGSGESTSFGPEAAAPVDRLLTGKRTPLPATNSLDVTTVSTEQQPAQGGSGSNAGQ